MCGDLGGPLIEEMAWDNNDIHGGCVRTLRNLMGRKVAIRLGHELSQGGLEPVLKSDIG
jgi:hypothetical protein